MKKAVFVVLLIPIVLMVGCSVFNSPSSVVREYYRAIEKNDMKALAKVTTPETLKKLSQLGTKAQNRVVALGKIKSLTERINGDTAVVTVEFEREEEKIDVKKINGVWKVCEWDNAW